MWKKIGVLHHNIYNINTKTKKIPKKVTTIK